MTPYSFLAIPVAVAGIVGAVMVVLIVRDLRRAERRDPVQRYREAGVL